MIDHRHTQVFRLDSALSPSSVPRPASHGRRHPTDDRQMAEGRSRRKRSSAPNDRGLPARGRDLALPLEHLPALRAGRMVRDRGAAAALRGTVPLSATLTMRSWRSTTSSTPSVSWQCWTSVLRRFGLTLHPDKTRLVDFRPRTGREHTPSGDGWDHVRLSRLDPRVGAVAQRKDMVRASHGQRPLCSCGGCGE